MRKQKIKFIDKSLFGPKTRPLKTQQVQRIHGRLSSLPDTTPPEPSTDYQFTYTFGDFPLAAPIIPQT